jgi:Uma2 family endonuclease
MAKALSVSELKRPRLTLSEFYALPEGPPYYEYEEGELIEMNRPTPRHQRILLKLGGVVSAHVEAQTLGQVYPEVNVELLGRRVYTPDLIFIAQEQAPEVDETDVVRVAPTLLVEISSPSTASRDHFVKLNTYAEAGVGWYWIVDPEALRILEYRLEEHGHYAVQSVVKRGQIFRPGLFPGLEIDLAALMGEGVETEEEEGNGL